MQPNENLHHVLTSSDFDMICFTSAFTGELVRQKNYQLVEFSEEHTHVFLAYVIVFLFCQRFEITELQNFSSRNNREQKRTWHHSLEDTTKRVVNLKEINFGRQSSSYAHFLVFHVSLCAIKKVSPTPKYESRLQISKTRGFFKNPRLKGH